VPREVPASPIGDAHDLGPTEAEQCFSVPAVSSIVGHLVLLVLAEAQAGTVHADGLEELLGEPHEVCQDLVADDALLHRIPDAYLQFPAVVGEQPHPIILDVLEAGPAFVLRVHEELTLHHVELTHAYDALARGDLIAVPAADLYNSQGQLLTVIAVEAGEVHEDPLSGLRTQVSHPAGTGTDHGLEHEVELLHRGQLPAAGGAGDPMLSYEAIQCLLVQGTGVGVAVADKMVRAVRLLADLALYHLVRELVHMAGRLEDHLRAYGLRIYLHETLAQRVQSSPDLHDVVPHGRAQGPIVVQASYPAVDLIGGVKETPALTERENV